MARNKINIAVLLPLLLTCGIAGTSWAQEDGRPAPEAPPEALPEETNESNPEPANELPVAEPINSRNADGYRPSSVLEPIEQAHLNRRPIPEGKINFAFDNVEIKEIVPWLAKITGKIVMPLKLDGSGIGIGSTGGKDHGHRRRAHREA